jgi:hypothetical protein
VRRSSRFEVPGVELACCAVDGDVGGARCPLGCEASSAEVDHGRAPWIDPESELDQLDPIAGVACMRDVPGSQASPSDFFSPSSSGKPVD